MEPLGRVRELIIPGKEAEWRQTILSFAGVCLPTLVINHNGNGKSLSYHHYINLYRTIVARLVKG
jgi:hypothetical protein